MYRIYNYPHVLNPAEVQPRLYISELAYQTPMSLCLIHFFLFPGASGWESNPSADKDKGSDGVPGGKRGGKSGWLQLQQPTLSKLERRHADDAKTRHKDSIGMPKVRVWSYVCTLTWADKSLIAASAIATDTCK
jgi:hypothetical protein